LHDFSSKDILERIRDGRLQLGLIVAPTKASELHDLRYEELFYERVCVAVAPQHPFARRRTVPIAEVAAEPLIGLIRENHSNFYDYLSRIFSKSKQKPRVVEEHDSFSAIMSAVEAGTGVAIGVDVFGHSFGNRVKLLHITPEPKPFSVGIVARKVDSAQPRKNSGSAPKKRHQKNRSSFVASGPFSRGRAALRRCRLATPMRFVY